jgi:hypothetical protein
MLIQGGAMIETNGMQQCRYHAQLDTWNPENALICSLKALFRGGLRLQCKTMIHLSIVSCPNYPALVYPTSEAAARLSNPDMLKAADLQAPTPHLPHPQPLNYPLRSYPASHPPPKPSPPRDPSHCFANASNSCASSSASSTSVSVSDAHDPQQHLRRSLPCLVA